MKNSTARDPQNCPAWCTREHPRKELEEYGGVYHSLFVTETPIGPISMTQLATVEGKATGQPAYLLLPDKAHEWDMTAEQAREVGYGLLDSADALDIVEGMRARARGRHIVFGNWPAHDDCADAIAEHLRGWVYERVPDMLEDELTFTAVDIMQILAAHYPALRGEER